MERTIAAMPESRFFPTRGHHMTTLTTDRLDLRPLEPADAPFIQRLAGMREVALNTLRIPHPYPDGAAEEFIQHCAEGSDVHFAITLHEDTGLIGVISLLMRRENDRAEIGYWIGVPFWGRGYATEAAGAVLGHGFETLKLNRIYAACFARNAASARVLQKIGMRHEGTLRQHIRKWDELVDLKFYGILKSDR